MKLKHLGRAFAVGAITLMLLGEVIAQPTTGPGTAPGAAPATAPAELPTKPAKGCALIVGVILDTEGKPMSNLELQFERQEPMAAGGGSSPRYKTPKVTTRVTDKDGKFAHETLEPASYIVIGGSQEVGWIYWPITAEKDKTLDMGEIKLTKV